MAARNPDGVFVALLRGINVGGRNVLPMAGLAGMFEKAGCRDVRTYIQSGNVVFRATLALASRVPEVIARGIAGRLGFLTPVVMRTGKELHAVARGNPFLRAGADPEALHVMFLADRPAAARVQALDPERSPPDEFQVRGREIYLRCPRGVAHTRLTNDWFDKALDTTSTMRN